MVIERVIYYADEWKYEPEDNQYVNIFTSEILTAEEFEGEY